jgi:N-methylhydantoinase B
MALSTARPNRIDPVTLEVVTNSLISSVREMGATLIRTAYSTIIREAYDCTTGLFDPDGRLLAQADHVPSHQGSLSYGARHVAETMPMEEGDVIALNHPYRGGTHHPDIMLFKPVFVDGRRVAISASLGHHLDVGGRSPGSVSTDARDVYEEGMLIPAIHLYRRGEPVKEIITLLESNIREPKKTLGDIRAQLASVSVGEQRYLELCRKYGVDGLAAISAAILDNSERLVREGLRQYEDGDYFAEGFMDNDGISQDPIRIAVTVRLRDGSAEVDFEGTNPQVKGPFNCSFSSVHAAVYCAVRYMVSPLVPQNEGCYRPISVIMPKGTIVNPREPAPLSGRFLTLERIANTIVMAFNKPRRKDAVGSSHAHLSAYAVSGRDPRLDKPFVFVEFMGGGWGGTRVCDGLDATYGFMANCMDVPIEALELGHPLRVERYELMTDSGGAGRFRGGLGLRRDVRYLHGEGYFTNRSETQKFPPPGVLGGHAGSASRHNITRANGRVEKLFSKVTNLSIEAGDVISMVSAGGGGYGKPLDRKPEQVLDDLLDGKVSPKIARQVYGVVIDGKKGAVDDKATGALRARLKKSRKKSRPRRRG